MTNFLCKIDKDGGLDFGSEFNLKRFRAFCKENKGKTLRIEKQISTRSLSQNNLYWFYLEIIERETGNDKNDLHEYFKRKHLPAKFINVFGQEVRIAGSTTELKKTDFSDYMEKICAETSIPIPDTESYHEFMESAPLK